MYESLSRLILFVYVRIKHRQRSLSDKRNPTTTHCGKFKKPQSEIRVVAVSKMTGTRSGIDEMPHHIVVIFERATM